MVRLFADIVFVFHFCVVLFFTTGFFLIPIGYKFSWRWVRNRKLSLDVIKRFKIGYVRKNFNIFENLQKKFSKKAIKEFLPKYTTLHDDWNFSKYCNI